MHVSGFEPSKFISPTRDKKNVARERKEWGKSLELAVTYSPN